MTLIESAKVVLNYNNQMLRYCYDLFDDRLVIQCCSGKYEFKRNGRSTTKHHIREIVIKEVTAGTIPPCDGNG